MLNHNFSYEMEVTEISHKMRIFYDQNIFVVIDYFVVLLFWNKLFVFQ